MNYKVLIAATLVGAIVHAEPALDPLPEGYLPMGPVDGRTMEGVCDAGVDTALAAAGQDNISIYCGMAEPSFGGWMRTLDAEPYRGRRVRYSAWIKGAGIEDAGGPDQPVIGSASLWIAVGSPSRGSLMDNLGDQSIRGHTSWEYREVVVDVPEDSRRILPGFWVRGKGQLWIRDQVLEVVSDSVPATLFWEERQNRPGPNLSLE